jgi:hypothetical protein
MAAVLPKVTKEGGFSLWKDVSSGRGDGGGSSRGVYTTMIRAKVVLRVGWLRC